MNYFNNFCYGKGGKQLTRSQQAATLKSVHIDLPYLNFSIVIMMIENVLETPPDKNYSRT